MSVVKDEDLIRQCHKLALKSHENGDLPFGALLTLDGHILSESCNTANGDITGHAEVNVLRTALALHPQVDLSLCTLYSNFEPCAMCSFLIRDLGVGRVVYSVASPHLGGISRWGILLDQIRPEFTTGKFGKSPEIIGGVLEDLCRQPFDKLNWRMHYID